MRRERGAHDATGASGRANGTWRKSSYSTAPDALCVEVNAGPHGVAIRDSKDRDGPILHFSRDEWRMFVLGVRDGEFDD